MSLYLTEVPEHFSSFIKEYRDRLAHLASIKALDIATSLKEVDPLATPPVMRTPKLFLTFPDRVWWDSSTIHISVPDIVGFEVLTVGTEAVSIGGITFNAADEELSFSKGELDPTSDIVLWGCSFGNSFLRDYMASLYPEVYSDIESVFRETALLGASSGYTREEFYRRLYDFLFFARQSYTVSSLEAAMNIAFGLPYTPVTGTIVAVGNHIEITKGSTNETVKVYIAPAHRPKISVVAGVQVNYGMPLTSILRVY